MRHALLLATLLATPAFAQEPPAYIDDRSTGAAVVKSYYNAIDRREYARAYSYFGASAAPDFAEWAKGYADTEAVTATIGDAAEEGAAGSLYYAVPVVLDVTRTDGGTVRFAGCYTLRLVQPANQEQPPFEGVHIEAATLKEVTGDDVMPASCQ